MILTFTDLIAYTKFLNFDLLKKKFKFIGMFRRSKLFFSFNLLQTANCDLLKFGPTIISQMFLVNFF